MSNILFTHFPKIAVKTAKEQAYGAAERMQIPLSTALGALNAIINKLELREAMDLNEHIDVGAARELLYKIEKEIEAVKELLSERDSKDNTPQNKVD